MTTLAFDRTMRRKDTDGRLHVEWTNISKAVVNPYYGREIPGAAELGLEPNRIYQMLRHPEELAKGAETFNNLPLLSRHEPVSAADPKEQLVAGSTGTDAEFRDPFLGNSLVVWRQEDIDDIESREKCELSCAYYYEPDMTPGEYKGLRYDGVMRNIKGNHVALVPQGRAGPDVMVHDEEIGMPLTSRKALMVRGVIAGQVLPLLKPGSRLAMDAILVDVTREGWAKQKPAIIERVVSRATPMLAQDAKLDAALLKLALDKADEEDDGAEDDDLEAMDADLTDEEREEEKEARAEDRKAGMSAKDRKKAMDARKTARDAKRAKDAKAAKDKKSAKDADKDDDKDDDEKESAEDRKKAMDAAISRATSETEARVVARMTAVAQAREDVRPYIGAVSLALDSAPAVYKAALDHLKVDVSDVPPEAYGAVLKTQPKPGAARVNTMANDGAATQSLERRFPALGRISLQ